MKKWEQWELDLLKTYKQQGTVPKVIAQLLSCSTEDVQKGLEELG